MSALLASSVLPTLREESNHCKKSNLRKFKEYKIPEKKVNFDSIFPDGRVATSRKIFLVTGQAALYSTVSYNLGPSEENKK
jgi:hypothetical protein